MNSTELHPLAYFEYITDSNNLMDVLQKNLYYSDYIHFQIINSTEIKYIEENNLKESVERSTPLKELLLPELRSEFEKAKNHLYKFCVYNSEINTKNYITIQINTLQTILNKNADFINKNIYFMLPLRGILSYINTYLLLQGMNKFELDESKIKFNIIGSKEQISFELNNKSDIEIIHSIFDYMNSFNEKREKILSAEDFELLIKYSSELIELECVPPIEKQLNPKISNDLLRFSFWVLHKELYKTTRIRSYFYDFIHTVFLNFKDNDIKSIQSQFGTKTRVTSYNFLPEIIKKNL